MGRPAWARSVAKPLALVAAQQLAGAEAADDAPAAAALARDLLRGVPVPEAAPGAGRAAVLAAKAPPGAGAGQAPRGRWRLVGYRALEELWILRCGPRRLVSLPAAPPLAWCPEGLALSETAPLQEEH
mmetsp:Transcript_100612/g.310270  ORF Transcript_100612/g.310270 Transcript_100612/m.310270 type:complete len:128 (-) Transcript_100612:37-420(-)